MIGVGGGSAVATTLGWAGFLGGLVLVGVARVGAWWHHE